MTEADSPTLTYQQDPSLIDPGVGEASIEHRNQAIEAILNPEGTLPQVTFMDRYERSPRQSQRSGIDTHSFAVFAADGVEIARAGVTTPYGKQAEKNPTAAINIVEIYPERQGDYKGKGYGKAIYMEILKRLPSGFELECDEGCVKPDAYKIWQWIESRGLAQRPAELGKPVLTKNGRYENLNYITKLAELAEFTATE